ncbi:MAG: RNA-directed DNA polymerase [Burkholderiales bacterium]|nr:MAG: RNA-directed DNA polymerase [Burkholderiales bacterium]
MHDQSFAKNTLEQMLQKGDFNGVPSAHQALFRQQTVARAIAAATTNFAATPVLLRSFPVKGKTVYGLSGLANELVARKLASNLRRHIKTYTKGRTHIVSSLKLLLEEGVPFRVYRLDIKSFYESFKHENISHAVEKLSRLAPLSKSLINAILDHHNSVGGSGTPRGLAMSASISDLMMKEFDLRTSANPEVFFYARYVDDIILITSCRERRRILISELLNNLPPGLELNPKKQRVVEASKKMSPLPHGSSTVELLRFDYLGYSFSVREPVKSRGADRPTQRDVLVDLAPAKIRKIKTRIARAFLDYSRNPDWPLLKDRIKFLTRNFGVYNAKAGGKKLAGIYYSYPLLSENAKALGALDRFLRNAILSRKGSIFSVSASILSAKQRQSLLGHSFVNGHSERHFVYFSPARISQIQECWKY